MKDINYYMALPYDVIVTGSVSEGFAASIPDLPGCITCADTIDVLFEMLEDAKKCWLAAAIEDGVNIKEPETEESYSGRFSLRIPKTLHKKLTEKARSEGVSLNQYCSYKLQESL